MDGVVGIECLCLGEIRNVWHNSDKHYFTYKGAHETNFNQ